MSIFQTFWQWHPSWTFYEWSSVQLRCSCSSSFFFSHSSSRTNRFRSFRKRAILTNFYAWHITGNHPMHQKSSKKRANTIKLRQDYLLPGNILQVLTELGLRKFPVTVRTRCSTPDPARTTFLHPHTQPVARLPNAKATKARLQVMLCYYLTKKMWWCVWWYFSAFPQLRS